MERHAPRDGVRGGPRSYSGVLGLVAPSPWVFGVLSAGLVVAFAIVFAVSCWG